MERFCLWANMPMQSKYNNFFGVGKLEKNNKLYYNDNFNTTDGCIC